jgi:L-rhamnose mutarotase|mmetsp:Transcript_23949/g.43312  ORF Transcript_23949/g.43312 Transcript_23949/m.43312 type:complete len:207 (-) Transcript_23949:564-1184(-)|eukprot:CAMPEP_0198288278 /NCGR_PEP_ID=MMETSP1449-20131203/6828_1 /TAXON_ID=420275 /ORGANISM="Attheya septentrionalis, Strain CCMP2084" /LENGTH=206 /DNA_ID=CAMNT_0043986391 /DNA_START=127 /DNA_END=750 /DNA_ORIENTATION=+
MKFVKSVLSVGAVLLSANVAFGKDYKRGDNKMKDAELDIQNAMAGMAQAGQDPAMLAQLMEDMKDPVLMREAQEMMNTPEFKKQMKKMQSSKEFKDASKKATDMMSDPGTAAKLTAKMEHMVQRGQDSLKKGAANSMKDAFDAFQDPDVMAEAAQMMRDPDFKKNMANMAKDPAFKNYIAAMQDMMQDPSMKSKIDELSNTFRSAL